MMRKKSFYFLNWALVQWVPEPGGGRHLHQGAGPALHQQEEGSPPHQSLIHWIFYMKEFTYRSQNHTPPEMIFPPLAIPPKFIVHVPYLQSLFLPCCIYFNLLTYIFPLSFNFFPFSFTFFVGFSSSLLLFPFLPSVIVWPPQSSEEGGIGVFPIYV